MMKAYADVSAGAARRALAGTTAGARTGGRDNRALDRRAQRMLTDNQARQSARRLRNQRGGTNRQ